MGPLSRLELCVFVPGGVGGTRKGKISMFMTKRTLEAALRGYHAEKIISNDKITARLKADYNIVTSVSTVKRRRKQYGLTGGAATEKILTATQIEQLVMNQMDEDTAKRWGVLTVWHKMSFDDGIILTRYALFNICDGHDKLYKIGFPIWMMVDDVTDKILKAWVVPSNRMGDVIAYLFLCLVEEYGGVPLQITTDCGSDDNAPWNCQRYLCHSPTHCSDMFQPELAAAGVQAHTYLHSVHNISVERSWLRLQLDFGDNAVLNFNKGKEDGVYDSNDDDHRQLCYWLWPRVLQQDLDKWAALCNGIPIRKQAGKAGPSGIKAMSRNEAFALHDWGGVNCLQTVDVGVIRQMKEDIGGEELIQFTSPEFSAHAQEAFESLGSPVLTQTNIWLVFERMLSLVFPERTF
ncbi:hypothetical protein K438DRAFT_1775735 [Mycena galopus ATCC 62051]|nr:hypothetical protein K438DRAFT_1775735 [Mycena galopus ATCC 62051]